ncbi:diguanylate cyclase [Maridesulfovibrio sp.]|uniref:sensor domain-containing diguanylate cyclase n=1 Tax=Maridesulfovibrio sp. TaxID=2795000 RepID=UPI0029F474DB|nr:diguanylate cyclase [Maridesulfovibrio sp.]
MRKFYEGKLVRKAIVLVFAVSFIGVIAVFYLYFVSLDSLAAENMKQRVMVALDVEAGIQQEILEEYTFWDEAYENCIVNVNKDWISVNTGEYMFSSHDVAFSLAVNSSGNFSYIDAVNKNDISKYERILRPKIAILLKKVSQSTLPAKLASGFISVDDEYFLVSAGLFMSRDTKDGRSPPSYLVFGKRFDDSYVKHIGLKYKLNTLAFSVDHGDSGHSFKLLDLEDRTIGYMVWNKIYPSRGILPFLAVVVCLFYIVTGGICVIVLKREAVNIKEQEEQLYFLATKDYLTGVSNRRHVMELGQQMLSAHQKKSYRLSVLVLDIDHFKSINDQFGHDIGDLALGAFSRICSNVLRSSDLFGRFGGEEFLAVLHDTEIENALEVAERMRRTVEAQTAKDLSIPLFTVSIGVSVDVPGDDFEMIVRRADEALYKAKAKGRNRVEVYVEDY